MTTVQKERWSYDQRVHALRYGGQTKFLARSAALSTGGTATTLIQTPDGQVALIDKLVIATQADHLTPADVTTTIDYLVFELVDADGTLRHRLPIFLANFDVGTPTSPLGNQVKSNAPIVWEPQAPLMVPSGWKLDVRQMDLGAGATPTTPPADLSHDTHKVQAFGILVDDGAARGAGYDVSNAGAQTSRNWIQTGSFLEVISPGSADGHTGILAPARTGMSILITDILLRLAPQVAQGGSGVQLRQSDGTVIFEWYNSVISQPLTRIIRPRIYLESGVGLEIHGIGSPCEDTSSIIVLGRYVPTDQVPTDCFWGNVQPPFPSGGLTSPDQASQAFTLNYPNKSPGSAFDTRISPGDGLTHILEGYEISVQKTSEIDTGPVIFQLGTGAVAGSGLISNVGSALPLTTVNWLARPGQNLTYGVDKISIPCQPNNGLIVFDVDRSSVLYGSPGTDAGLENWSCTVWGRTLPTSHRATGGDLTYLKGTN